METKRQRQNLMHRRYMLKKSYELWTKKKADKETELNKLKFNTMVKLNNKLNRIANKIEEITFYLDEL